MNATLIYFCLPRGSPLQNDRICIPSKQSPPSSLTLAAAHFSSRDRFLALAARTIVPSRASRPA